MARQSFLEPGLLARHNISGALKLEQILGAVCRAAMALSKLWPRPRT